MSEASSQKQCVATSVYVLSTVNSLCATPHVVDYKYIMIDYTMKVLSLSRIWIERDILLPDDHSQLE